MATIGKNLIIELREITGLGMMDCKNALEATDGNIDAAIELLRKKGAATATPFLLIVPLIHSSVMSNSQ